MRLSCTIVLSVLFLIPAQVNASYEASCILKAEVISVDDSPQPRAELRVKVTKFVSGRGHSSRHCRDFPGNTYTFQADLPESGRAIQSGQIRTLLFKTTTGEEVVKGKAKLISSTTWQIEPCFLCWW